MLLIFLNAYSQALKGFVRREMGNLSGFFFSFLDFLLCDSLEVL